MGNTNKNNPARKDPPKITALEKVHSTRNICYYCQFSIHFILLVFQFISQLAVVPLLLIKVFDTYGYLCFSHDSYCTMTEEYSLHLHKTAITFGFYCSLTLSFASSTMLNWVPWPNSQHPKESTTTTNKEAFLPLEHNETFPPTEANSTLLHNFPLPDRIDIPSSPKPTTTASSNQFYTPIDVDSKLEYTKHSASPVPRFPGYTLPFSSTFTSHTSENA